MSIISFPDRGHWGNSQWRGNCSGYVYKDLFERLHPRVFVDPMVGSGTSVDVAREMGIEAYGLDLHSGFNVLRDSILERVGKPADLVVSHPPYGSMILYSGQVWGDQPHPDDLSRCADDEEFHQKLQVAMLNQRAATRSGGYYGTIIGDLRRNGRYVSYQAEVIARMPADELAAVIIKQQHNCVSDARSYGKMTLPRITHEYLLLFKRHEATSILLSLASLAKQQYSRLAGTWKAIVRCTLIELGGKATLDRIYSAIAAAAPEKLASNPNWQAKIRQVLNQNRDTFTSVARGMWSIA